MARFSSAVWSGPIPNFTPAGMQYPIMGLVLHIEQGSETSADNWFHNPAAQASAHFGNPMSGQLQQWVDTSDEAWAEMQGNSRWISVEHEGFSGNSLTSSQIANDAALLAWLNQTYGVPLQPTDSPETPGLGWHGMGGDAWGGHLQCPGDPIIAQRGEIIALAQQILGHPTPPPPTSKTIILKGLPMALDEGTADGFVRLVYRDLLKREADPGGWLTFVGGLTNGSLTPGQVVASIMDSPEGVKVINAERKLLGL